MSVFYKRAINTVLKHEGGFVDDPVDPGGATNFGVSLRWLVTAGDLDGDGKLDGDINGDGIVDAVDIKSMTRADAIDLYKAHFWDRFDYDRIFDPDIAVKVFDLTVNMGSGYKSRTGAHTLLQRACRAVGRPLVEDGLLGPNSIREINAAASSSELGAGALLAAYRSEAAGFYRGLVTAKPVRKRFINGWLKRAYS